MNEYLIRTSAPENYPPENFRSVWDTKQVNGDSVLEILAPSNPTLEGDELIGAWTKAGVAVEAVKQALYEQIRPLGNYPDGTATDHLLYSHYAGFKARQLGTPNNETLGRYPDNNQPMPLECRLKYFTGTWSGYGYRVESSIEWSMARDPSIRSLAIYADPDFTQYLYTTGAFLWGSSEWQGAGDVWYAETPLGQLSPENKPFYIGLWAGKLEGHVTLIPDEREVVNALFWLENQPE